MQFVRFQSVDACQDVGIPVDWIDAVAFGSRDERQMNCDCFGTVVGAGKEAIFSYQNPALYGPFGLIVVYRNIWIFKKSGQSFPVLERVIDCLHQFVSGSELFLGASDDTSKALHERFRFSAPHCQSELRRFVLNFSLDIVEIPVDIENDGTNFCLGELRFKILAPRVGAAASFNSLTILKQCIESAGGISLNDSFEVFEEFEVLIERQVRRKVEHGYLALDAYIRCNFPFADVVFVLAVLDLDGRVIGFDDARCEQLFLHQVVEKRKRVCGRLHPVALGGTRYFDVMAGEDFFLAIVRETVVELADDCFSNQARTGVAARDGGAWLFGSNDVLLAARAGTCFLKMFNNLQAGAYHFKLVSDDIADVFGFDGAMWAKHVFRFYRMLYRLMRNILCVVENVLDTNTLISFPGCIGTGSWFRLADSGARVMLLGLFPVFSFVAFLRLGDQLIELSLQIFEQCSQLVVTVERLLELMLQSFIQLNETMNLCPWVGVFFFQPFEFVHEAPLLVSNGLYTI